MWPQLAGRGRRGCCLTQAEQRTRIVLENSPARRLSVGRRRDWHHRTDMRLSRIADDNDPRFHKEMCRSATHIIVAGPIPSQNRKGRRGSCIGLVNETVTDYLVAAVIVGPRPASFFIQRHPSLTRRTCSKREISCTEGSRAGVPLTTITSPIFRSVGFMPLFSRLKAATHVAV